jgi:pimeloyl-ACP methyl ester carboxylesterase
MLVNSAFSVIKNKMTTIILPGMGADSRMYPYEKYGHIQDVIFSEWPEYKNETTLKAVALSVIEQHKINSNMVVGGSSLGGMVAVEIAKAVGIKQVILIGSTTHPKYINPLLQKLSGLSEITPVKIIQFLADMANISGKNELLSMFQKSDSRFIKAMCKALFKWEGLTDYQCKVCHIHGKKDKVILPPENNVELISEGGHLISMTHSERVANFINENKNIY